MITICVKCNNTDLLNYLKNKLLKSDLENLVIHENQFKIFNNIIIHFSSENLESFYHLFCSTLSNLIINYYELTLLKRIIALNYYYFNQDDVNIILDEFAILKENQSYNKVYVNSLLFSSIYDYIVQNKVIVISGFVNFRLKAYVDYLENILSEAINQYIIDREYFNFVNLLQSYINSKIPNNLVVNLIYINSNGILLSNNGDIIELEPFNNSYLSDISFSRNDCVLNTLISLLPKKIIIHLISPKDQFIKTIEMIFFNKVFYCDNCELCKTYKTLKLK